MANFILYVVSSSTLKYHLLYENFQKTTKGENDQNIKWSPFLHICRKMANFVINVVYLMCNDMVCYYLHEENLKNLKVENY